MAGFLASMVPLPVAAEDSVYPVASPAETGRTNTVSVRWKKPRDGRPVAEVTGLDPGRLATLAAKADPPADWRRILRIHTGPRGAVRRDLPQLAGDYSVTNGVLRFRMAFPVNFDVEYRAEFHPAEFNGFGGDQVAYDRLFLLPPASGRDQPQTTLAEVQPSAAELPENLLKFYLRFSGPMQRGDAYRHIRLLDESGAPVELPFLELDEELWDPEQTRLTLLLDPGRIKRGVLPNEESGSALVVGRSYTLSVDASWPDASGRPLKSGFRRRFRVGPADRQSPDPELWSIRPPVAGARTVLEVSFGEPLDHALAERLLAVHDLAGKPVDGSVSLSDSDRKWSFVPSTPWKPGVYRLKVGAALEDLAGNRMDRLFDVDLAATPSTSASAKPASAGAVRTFEVR